MRAKLIRLLFCVLIAALGAPADQAPASKSISPAFLAAAPPAAQAGPPAAFRPGTPYVGVSYYPDVAGDQIDDDIRHMKELGVNMVRFGDFAWSAMEPSEGKYDFAWMHRAVDKFAAAKIAVVLCTPTAAPPAWLSAAHPEILRIGAAGQRIGHGGRRHYCPNSPLYREYSRRIAARLGEEFGKDPSVVAWQIDNEFWDDCYCDICLAAFRRWLERRYGTVGELNALWLTTLWSQTYSSFDQVPLPIPQRAGGQHHPSLRLAYRRFLGESYISYCMEQARELRKYTKAGITTNGHNPRYQKIDYPDLFRGLDLVGTDSYAGPEDLMRYAFEADWMRPLGKPFWLAETSSTYAAGTVAGGDTDFAFAPGALRAKMWLNYALGAEAVSFWLWRVHWAGQELEHGSLLYPWGDETVNTPEVRQVAQEIGRNAAWLASTRPAPRSAALHYGVSEQLQFEATGIADGFDYDSAISGFHKMLANAGVARDVIAPEAPVDGYRIVFSPYLPYIPAETMTRMRRFVEAGGTWVIGPLSACRTAEATAFRDGAYGADFENWLGVHVRHRVPAHASIKLAAGSDALACKWWCDAYQPGSGRKTLARYAGGALDGLAGVVDCPVGRGRVILVGTQPPETWWRGLFRDLIGPDAFAATPGVDVCPRVDAEGRPAGVIAVNTTAAAGSFVLSGTKRELGPYDVLAAPAASRK